MKNICVPWEMYSDDELRRLHESSLRILSEIGMEIMVPEFLESLEQQGAKVDHQKQVVKFPPELVEKTLEMAKNERGKVTKLPFSWHNNFTLDTRPASVKASFGGACLYLYDHEKQSIRETTSEDMRTMVQLGEAIPEVASIGNPLIYLREPDGATVPAELQALKGAGLIAKNTSRPGSAQVTNTKDLELIIEIGIVLKGSWEAFKKEPILMGVKEPTPPLRLTNTPGEVIAFMAKKELPCHITPMPLMGLSAPITPAGAMAIGNAEILGIWTCIKSLTPTAPVEASTVAGVMDMRTGRAIFGVPEPVLIDLGLAQLYGRYYGLEYNHGVSWIDAKYPGAQAGLERMFKLMTCAVGGMINYPAGAISGNTVFSPEQAMIDIEMGKLLNRYLDGAEITDETLCFDLIKEQGIGGNFFSEEHTAANFRQQVFLPHLMDKTAAICGPIEADKDIVETAHKQWKEILEKTAPFHLDEDKVREIDKIVAKGEKILL